MIGLALVVIAIDQFVKNLALANLEPGIPVSVWGEILRWNLAFNEGAAFSIGFGVTWIFTLASTLATLVLLWYSAKLYSLSWAIMGGVLLGGVVGNLIDRLIRDPGFPSGYVIDYIQIPFNFPIFNIADMAIVSMAILSAIRVIAGQNIGGKPTARADD